MPGLWVFRPNSSKERNVSRMTSGGYNHSKMPENNDPPSTGDKNIYLVTNLSIKFQYLIICILHYETGYSNSLKL
jgi:hypothetical protein